MTEVLLLASGGLDSTTLAYWLCAKGRVVRPLFFDYGQHCVEKEWNTLQNVLQEKTLAPERISISGIFSSSKSRLIVEPDLWTEPVRDEELYVPYRTLLFFAASAAHAQTIGISQVYSAFINSSHAKELDCSTAGNPRISRASREAHGFVTGPGARLRRRRRPRRGLAGWSGSWRSR